MIDQWINKKINGEEIAYDKWNGASCPFFRRFEKKNEARIDRPSFVISPPLQKINIWILAGVEQKIETAATIARNPRRMSTAIMHTGAFYDFGDFTLKVSLLRMKVNLVGEDCGIGCRRLLWFERLNRPIRIRFWLRGRETHGTLRMIGDRISATCCLREPLKSFDPIGTRCLYWWDDVGILPKWVVHWL